MYSLRPYQTDLLNRIFELWKSDRRRVLAQLPTGGGKTVLFGEVAREFICRGERVLILAHREELVKQAADKVGTITGEAIGIVKAGYKPDYGRSVQVASVQSLVNRLALLENVDLVIVDESHHATARTYRKVLEAYPDAYLLGVTATPIRLDGSGFRDLFDELVCGVSVRELIDDGFLSRFKLFADPNPMKTKGARTRNGDYAANDLAEINNAVELSGNLLGSYRRHADGKRCVVFAVNVDHSIAIADRYNAAGIPAIHLDGNSDREYRSDALDRFARGEIKVISNCQLFDEGLDIPALEAVQIAKPTKSLSRWLQMVGRSLRVSEGKEHAIIIDHTKNWAIHGLPTRKHHWSLDGVESEAIARLKVEAGEVIEKEPLPPPAIEETGELTEIDQPEDSELEAWMDAFLNLVTEQEAMGFSTGWIYYRLLELKPPLEIWREYAAMRGYKPGWAFYRWREQERQRLPGEPSSLPPRNNLFSLLSGSR